MWIDKKQVEKHRRSIALNVFLSVSLALTLCHFLFFEKTKSHMVYVPETTIVKDTIIVRDTILIYKRQPARMVDTIETNKETQIDY